MAVTSSAGVPVLSTDNDAVLCCRRYSSEVKGGYEESLSVERLNAHYELCDIGRSLDDVTKRIADPTMLVISVDLHDMLPILRFCSGKDLRRLGLYHGVSLTGARSCNEKRKTALMSHECDDMCRKLYYVFKPLVTRRFHVSRPRGAGRRVGCLNQVGGRGGQHAHDRQITGHDNLTEWGGKNGDAGRSRVGCEDEKRGGYDEHLKPASDEVKRDIIIEWQNETSTEMCTMVVCAVCAKKLPKSRTKFVDGNTIDLRSLRNDNLHEKVLPRTYNFVAYERAILNPKGLDDVNVVGRMTICIECMQSLEKGKMPMFALCNGLYYGHDSLPSDVAAAFAESTLFDRMMICRARANNICCRFRRGYEDSEYETSDMTNFRMRRGMRGNVLVAPLDVVRMNEVIPPSSETIKDTMCAIFIGKKVPSQSSIKNFHPILVRKSRVRKMITFLLQNNMNYGRVGGFAGFSEENLNRLFSGEEDEGVPCSVHLGFLAGSNAVDAVTSDYTPRNVDDTVQQFIDIGNCEDTDVLMENVGYTMGDDSPRSYGIMKAIALQRCLSGKSFIVSRVGQRPIPDFNNPYMLSWMFPHLDPWGIGGFLDPKRRVKITVAQQVTHLLLTESGLFQRDPEFAFVYYNFVIRKQHIFTNLKFVVPQSVHTSIARRLLEVDLDTLTELTDKFRRDPHFKASSDGELSILRLLGSIALSARHLPGSDGYKVMRRNEIRAMINEKGTPTLFITINPSDVDNPLVRVYAGENIDLDDRMRGEDLDAWRRRVFAANNPVACALFFDKLVQLFIRVILRYGRSGGGLYGVCKGYYGTVEAQGKGTLHCHMLVWLEGHPSPQVLRDRMMESVDYRTKMFLWLESNVRNEFLGSGHDGSLKEGDVMPLKRVRSVDIGVPHPGTIAAPSIAHSEPSVFAEEYRQYVNRLLMEYSWHVHQATCWKYLARGQEGTRNDKQCRLGMDGKLRQETSLDPETQSILLRRLHPWIASYTDLVVFLMKCNMDIKFIGSGEAAKAFLYYVTDYITKPSLPVHVGLAALSYAIGQTFLKVPDMLPVATSRQALSAATISVNSMAAHQEISHQQVMSYLVGGGDHYTSDQFCFVRWGSIVGQVERIFERGGGGGDEGTRQGVLSAEEPTVQLEVGCQSITGSNQWLDYTYRSKDEWFDKQCFYEFVSWVVKVKRNIAQSARDTGDTWRGCFSSWEHPQRGTHYLRVRNSKVIPVLLGPTLPRSDRTMEEREVWAKHVLILFKPWRTVTDLKLSGQTWTDAYDEHEISLSAAARAIIKNMNVLTECREARTEHASQRVRRNLSPVRNDVDCIVDGLMHEEEAVYDGIDSAYGVFHHSEGVGGDIWSGEVDGVLGRETINMMEYCLRTGVVDSVTSRGVVAEMTSEDHTVLAQQMSFMTEQKKRRRPSVDEEDGRRMRKRVKMTVSDTSPNVELCTIRDLPWGEQTMNESVNVEVYRGWVEETIVEMKLRNNPEQLRAFEIVAAHVLGVSKPLLMYVAGVGGTGKSHVIKAIVSLFEKLGRRRELMIGAPTGIAAVLVGGFTLHSLILTGLRKRSQDVGKLASLWKGVRYLIVDEVSMVGAKFLSQISERIRLAKGDDYENRWRPFGGVNVIFMGDFGQLKPPQQYSLYSHQLIKRPSFAESRNAEGITAMNGILLWRQVNIVVELTRNQRHSSDPGYAAFLARLRIGACLTPQNKGAADTDDLTYIKSRLLENLGNRPEELNEFRDAPVIVGSRLVRDSLNVTLISQHASRLGESVFLYHSIDVMDKSRPVEGIRQVLWSRPTTETGDSLGRLPLFPGMRVMITENIAFMQGIVNGVEGIVRDVKYEVDDRGRRFANVVYVWIEGCGMLIDGLDRDVVPIFPVSTSIKVTFSRGNCFVEKSVTRRQAPLMPSYAYTDFKSQGRTLERAIVDLATAKGQGVYVMLSRVRSLRGLVILRWFPPTKLYQRIPEELREEFVRISELDGVTQKQHDEGLYGRGLLENESMT